MKRPLLAVWYFAVRLSAPALACMNEYEPNTPALQRAQSLMTQLQEHHETEAWPTRRDRLRKELAAGGDYRVKNDLATALAHTGEAAESVRLLQEIEEEKPGLYKTASNLGTAFELVGENRKALEWIRRGIERDAKAHDGTEWLHVRILEAKLALAGNPGWLDSNSVLGPRHDQSIYRSATGNRGEALAAEQVKTALVYQLHERLQFVQPPDAIVGDLYFALGKLVAQESTGIGGAILLFGWSAHYLEGVPNLRDLKAVVHRQVQLAERAQQEAIRRSRSATTGVMIVGAGMLVYLVLWLRRLAW
jgi:hypothetical protein